MLRQSFISPHATFSGHNRAMLQKYKR